jgi:hypothetical protein
VRKYLFRAIKLSNLENCRALKLSKLATGSIWYLFSIDVTCHMLSLPYDIYDIICHEFKYFEKKKKIEICIIYVPCFIVPRNALLYPEIIQKLSARNNLLLQFFFYNMKLQLKPTTLRGFYGG